MRGLDPSSTDLLSGRAPGPSLPSRVERVGEAVAQWTDEPWSRVGTPLIGPLLGLEMMRRVHPVAVNDDSAIPALRCVPTTTGAHR